MPPFLHLVLLSLCVLLLTTGACVAPNPGGEVKAEAPRAEGLVEKEASLEDAAADVPFTDTPSTEGEAPRPESPEGRAEAPPAEQAPDCERSCPASASRCSGPTALQRCTLLGGCAVWGSEEACPLPQICKDGSCTARSCDRPGLCGAGFHCEAGVCESNASCCTPGAMRCSSGAEQACKDGGDQCGRWSEATLCSAEASCGKDRCEACFQRPCTLSNGCCAKASCSYGFCLAQCDEAKGDINNPDCKKDEFCFSLTPGAPALCYPDGNEPKGASCSIVKVCGGGLSCVDIGKGFLCFSDCDPLKGGAGNPGCTAQEQCVRVTGASLGGICVPLQVPPAKLYEVCSTSIPCVSPDLCIGEPGAAASHCLAPCDPTVQPPPCPADFVCAAYDPATPTKGVCLQICQNPGSKDVCIYGECRSKGPQSLCL